MAYQMNGASIDAVKKAVAVKTNPSRPAAKIPAKIPKKDGPSNAPLTKPTGTRKGRGKRLVLD